MYPHIVPSKVKGISVCFRRNRSNITLHIFMFGIDLNVGHSTSTMSTHPQLPVSDSVLPGKPTSPFHCFVHINTRYSMATVLTLISTNRQGSQTGPRLSA